MKKRFLLILAVIGLAVVGTGLIVGAEMAADTDIAADIGLNEIIETPAADASGLSSCSFTADGSKGVVGRCTSTSSSSEVVRYAARAYCQNNSGAKFYRYGTWYSAPGSWSLATCASNETRLSYKLALRTW